MSTVPQHLSDDAAQRPGSVALSARTHRRRALILGGLALFQFWLWGTRIWNLVGDADDFSTAFVAVHLVLYVAAIGAGVVLAVMGHRMWREGRLPGAGGSGS